MKIRLFLFSFFIMNFIHAQDEPYLARLHPAVTLNDLFERGVQAKYAYNFDPVKPFKVKSVDGYAMILNLKKLKKIDNFNFFDENFFLYLENEDICKRLIENDENIYVIPKSKINHLGGKAVDPIYKNEIEYLRNWHWMWSKFYFNKKHYGYFIAVSKVFKNLITAKIKFLYFLITLNTFKRKIYQMRLLGLINSMIGKNSYYRPKL